jgi:hypothetical protein
VMQRRGAAWFYKVLGTARHRRHTSIDDRRHTTIDGIPA